MFSKEACSRNCLLISSLSKRTEGISSRWRMVHIFLMLIWRMYTDCPWRWVVDVVFYREARVFSRKLGKLPLPEPIVCFWDTRRIDHSFNRSQHVVRARSRHVVRMRAHSLGKNRSRWDFLVFTIDFLMFKNIHVHTFTPARCAVVVMLNSYNRV